MVWVMSFIGIVFLVILNYMIYRRENPDGKTRMFIRSKKCWETLIELIVIVLGATLAINFSDIQQARDNKEKVVLLLEASRGEVATSYLANEYWISKYETKEATLGELKYNLHYNIRTLDNLLDNDVVIITLTPISYSVFCNQIDLTNFFNKKLQESEEDDEYIYTYIKALNSHLENILFEIDNEILYLEGEYKAKEVEIKYNEFLKSKYIPIT